MVKKCSIIFFAFFALALMTPCSYSLADELEKNKDQTPTEQEEKAADLADMVVTANRNETPIENIPASVTVITREEIAESSGLRVDHILRKYAGLDVSRSSFLSHSADVVLRGMGEMPGIVRVLKISSANFAEEAGSTYLAEQHLHDKIRYQRHW